MMSITSITNKKIFSYSLKIQVVTVSLESNQPHHSQCVGQSWNKAAFLSNITINDLDIHTSHPKTFTVVITEQETT